MPYSARHGPSCSRGPLCASRLPAPRNGSADSHGLCACRQTFRFTSAHGAHRRTAHFGRHSAPAHGAHPHRMGSTRRPATSRPSRLRSRICKPIACRHGSGHRPCCPRWGTRRCTEERCRSWQSSMLWVALRSSTGGCRRVRPPFSPVARSPFRPSLTHMTSLCSWSVLSPALRLAQHSSKSMTRSAGGWHVTVSHHLPRQHGA